MKDPAHVVGLIGLSGIIYVLLVSRRMWRQTTYKPVLEDWVWHLILPMIAYVMAFVAAAGMSHDQRWALFAIGGVALLLLCIGIHNAWDTVTYVVMSGREDVGKTEK
jgi:bacteriorhodopsin